MPTDLFRARAPGDAPHPMLPLPGPKPGSIAPEEADANATSLGVYELHVEITDGLTTRRVAYGDELRATLLITDSRVVFASTKMLKSFRGTRDQTFMGHLRYEWLEGLDGANYNFIKTASYLRLFARDPADPDWMTVATFKPGRGWGGKDVAADVARRAEAWRSRESGGDAAGFSVSELRNGGTRWLIEPGGSERFAPVVKQISDKGLGLLG